MRRQTPFPCTHNLKKPTQALLRVHLLTHTRISVLVYRRWISTLHEWCPGSIIIIVYSDKPHAETHTYLHLVAHVGMQGFEIVPLRARTHPNCVNAGYSMCAFHRRSSGLMPCTPFQAHMHTCTPVAPYAWHFRECCERAQYASVLHTQHKLPCAHTRLACAAHTHVQPRKHTYIIEFPVAVCYTKQFRLS